MLTACGGGSGAISGPGIGVDPQPATVGVVISDASNNDFDEAIATITSVELLCENGQQTLFTGSATFDLLRLASFVELLAVNDTVRPDTCSKIRLRLDSLVLNNLDAGGSVTSSINATLVANGKVDLTPDAPFTIHPGETLFVSFDFDVEKSLKITETGNGKFIVRPVIFVDVGGSPGFKNGLTRVSGIVNTISPDAGMMHICMNGITAQPLSTDSTDDLPERCLDVVLDNDGLGNDTGIFGEDGLPIQATELLPGDPVTVAGLLAVAVDDGGLTSLAVQPGSESDNDTQNGDDSNDAADSDSGSDSGNDDADSDSDDDAGLPPALPLVIDAIVVERGSPGTFLQISGMLQTGVDPATDTYELLVAPNQGITIDPDNILAGQLFAQSRIIDPDGMNVDRTALTTGDMALADGILLLNNGAGAIDTLRTSLMIIRQDAAINPPIPAEDVLKGTIASIDQQTLLVTTAETGDRCVNHPDAVVLFIVKSGDSLDVTRGTIDLLDPGMEVTIFGTENSGGCFDADVIVTIG